MSHLGDQLSAVVDGELCGAELDRANAHLAACHACQLEAHALRRLKQQLRALAADVGDPGDFTGRLLAISGAARADPAQAPAAQVSSRLLLASSGGYQLRPAGRGRGRQVLWGTLSLVVVGIGSAAFGLGAAAAPGPRIAPQFEVYDQQHAATSGDLPWPDSAEAVGGRVALTGRVRAA